MNERHLRGTILETEVVNGAFVTRVSEVDVDGRQHDISIQTGTHNALPLRLEDDTGVVMVLPQRGRSG